ncbi:unnamed protein product [Kuraishia capsulata CBS 1993]|uniref:Zinc transporter YKE4 n=1 Tax=Kuraishia capsulata CBS 1993 TaxID=1382522 RepID=W6MK93_9ASCO|nr:uncharacterized protein KUCA_T00000999001 [Kuraishia capsulata CBS 1993]CDK25032.1 unnamed protein product [Kuraishia capsulata CBS 1993]
MRFTHLLALAAILGVSHSHGFFKPKESRPQADLYYENGVINLESLGDQLAQCDVVKKLNTVSDHEHHSTFKIKADKLYEYVFPFSEAGNALLATAYISGPPNFILALIPADIDVYSLSMLVSFAIGGLLGDVFLHLLPQTFFGEKIEEGYSFILVDEKRNCILGLFIFFGFLVFFIIDKSLRILEHTGEEGEGNSHSHSHSHSAAVTPVEAVPKETSKRRKGKGSKSLSKTEKVAAIVDQPVIANPNASVKTSAYLNLISDFCHNITDGLAISASFYISRSVGCTTTLAVFFHEIPHEIGDFALLIQGGFTKWQAMGFQFVTAIGAFLGTAIGIGIQEFSKDLNVATKLENAYAGLFGTTVEIGDLTLPFTAGGFLYIATVGVIPEVLELEKGSSRSVEIIRGFFQLFWLGVGISIMFAIAWFE